MKKQDNPKSMAEALTTPPCGRRRSTDLLKPPTLSRRRKWFFRCTAAAVVPLLALGILETALRLAGYGHPSSFFIRRARLEAGGILFKHYEYKVQADFADTGSTLLRDGFININYAKEAQFQFGQFKAPFSQEELTPLMEERG
mgnify:CR=1 FL=1